jgi:hypothetical protein
VDLGLDELAIQKEERVLAGLQKALRQAEEADAAATERKRIKDWEENVARKKRAVEKLPELALGIEVALENLAGKLEAFGMATILASATLDPDPNHGGEFYLKDWLNLAPRPTTGDSPEGPVLPTLGTEVAHAIWVALRGSAYSEVLNRNLCGIPPMESVFALPPEVLNRSLSERLKAALPVKLATAFNDHYYQRPAPVLTREQKLERDRRHYASLPKVSDIVPVYPTEQLAARRQAEVEADAERIDAIRHGVEHPIPPPGYAPAFAPRNSLDAAFENHKATVSYRQPPGPAVEVDQSYLDKFMAEHPELEEMP